MKCRSLFNLVAVLLAISLYPSRAESFVWQFPYGTVQVIEIDDGLSILSGATDFGFWYANIWPCGDGCVAEFVSPNEARYVFDSSSAVSGLLKNQFSPSATWSSTTGNSIRIADDVLVDQELVDWAFPLGLAMTVGQEIDLLEFNGRALGEDPSDTIEWTVRAIYTASEPHSGLDEYSTSSWYSYRSQPQAPDLLAFEVREGGGAVFSARGEIEAVPEPRFGLGLLGAAASLLLLGKPAVRPRC